MSAPAIALAAKVVAGAFAAVNVIKGLKEGNLLQAVMGGVSAYAAFSGLGAMTATQNAAASGAQGVANQAATLTGTLGEGAATVSGVAQGATGGSGAFGALTEGIGQTAQMGTDLIGGAAQELPSAALDFGAGAAEGASGFLQSGALSAAEQGASIFGDTALQASQGAAPFDLVSGQADIMPNLVESGAGVAAPQAAQGGGFLSGVTDWANQNPTLASGAMKIGGQMLSGYAQGKQQEELLERQQRLIDEQRRRRGAAAGNVGWQRR